MVAYVDAHPEALGLSSTAMLYEADPGGATLLPECLQGLTVADVLGSKGAYGRGDSGLDDARQHLSRVVLGLLYLAGGGAGLDLSHNMVTPLCWASPTAYGGPPLTGVSAPTRASAAYVHAMVHRFEGCQDGEFGRCAGSPPPWAAGSASAAPHASAGS